MSGNWNLDDWPKRFWSRVNKRGPISKVNPRLGRCWIWTGATTGLGLSGEYGVSRRYGKKVLAHRLSYELAIGLIPKGMEPDHLCRVSLCVRPEHLEPVTHKVNCLRGARSAARVAKTTCRKGHQLPKGSFVCVLCRRAKQLRHYYKYRDAINTNRREKRKCNAPK